ncbi:MAG: hypothetical protein HC945_03945, partial [Nitrosarchaeum sp.]|nr:hypothetical protein [Nitrosarchaeum sp.]
MRLRHACGEEFELVSLSNRLIFPELHLSGGVCEYQTNEKAGEKTVKLVQVLSGLRKESWCDLVRQRFVVDASDLKGQYELTERLARHLLSSAPVSSAKTYPVLDWSRWKQDGSREQYRALHMDD